MAKYVARVPIGNNSFRYFYSAEEYGAYKDHKNKAAAAKVKKGKGKTKKGSGGVKIPKGHVATASPGSVISGYNGTGKPENISDAAWNKLTKMWGTTYSAQKSEKKPKKTSLRTKLVYSLDRRNMAKKSKHSAGHF